eukprot:375036_1
MNFSFMLLSVFACMQFEPTCFCYSAALLPSGYHYLSLLEDGIIDSLSLPQIVNSIHEIQQKMDLDSNPSSIKQLESIHTKFVDYFADRHKKLLSSYLTFNINKMNWEFWKIESNYIPNNKFLECEIKGISQANQTDLEINQYKFLVSNVSQS